ncbi:uncharacterized protein BKA55DRAFT_537376 [Fusarium redolens]|uniref:Uncharacterized protein n=1 Tax=Fusarium redolens TaxID=48865 RepID=A0A9P9HMK0_FUSRE|nr:uncharacterized protein BKA55DRAFT_537376 [Fusarium redolens]KAH7259688.1 hypothetical protein BKA55DRAFT_537376 [Fusarium redolens]
MAAKSGRELLLFRLGFSGSLLCVEGPDGQQQVAATQTSRPSSAPKSGARAISSASAVVLNVGRHRWMALRYEPGLYVGLKTNVKWPREWSPLKYSRPEAS